jgi:hypothetical protein
LPDDRLHKFQAHFSFLLGSYLADPHYATALRRGHFVINTNFDYLAAPQVKPSTQPETFLRRIENQAGEPSRPAFQIDDQARALLQWHTLRAAIFGDRQAGHFSHILV